MSKLPLTKAEIETIETQLALVESAQFYRLLDIGLNSDTETIQKAYYRLSKLWHPDAYFTKDLGTYSTMIDNIFMGITEAYHTLIDAKKRSAYDRSHSIQSVATSTDVTNNASRKRHRRGKRRRARTQTETTTAGQDLRQSMRDRRRQEILGKVSTTLDGQIEQAARHYRSGLDAYATGDIMRASTEIHLACEFAPTNQEYLEKHKMVRKEARRLKAREFIAAAENAESFQNWGRAIEQYRKAVSYDCDSAAPYARLAYLLSRLDPDPREVIRLLQIAVQKESDNAEYHCLLAESYFRQGMSLNAKREFQAAIAIQKDFQRAIDGLRVL